MLIVELDGARKLLAEAGYPDGFALTLHGPNDRYVNDDQICQAIAQMLSRVGIQTRVETLPSAVYFFARDQARIQHDAGRLGAPTPRKRRRRSKRSSRPMT